jgi:hypothetical protein
MKLIVTLILLFGLVFLLTNAQGTILKLGKSAGRIAKLDVPCEETGVTHEQYQELIRLAAVSCHSADIAKYVSEIKYCYPDADIVLPKLKNVNTYFLQPGDHGAVCIHEDYFDDERDTLIKDCYDEQTEIRALVGNFYDAIRLSRCIFAHLEEKELMRRDVAEGKCGKFVPIGHLDNPGTDCLEPKFAKKYDKDYPTVTYTLQGTCPDKFKELASRKMFELGQASKSTLSVLERVDELPQSFDSIQILPRSVIYEEVYFETESDKLGKVYFEVQNTGKFGLNPGLFLATGESDVVVVDATWKGKTLGGSSGRLTLAPGEIKRVTAHLIYKKLFVPFTLHLHIDFFGQHIPVGAIKVPATPTLFIRPGSVQINEAERHRIILEATNPFNEPAVFSPLFTLTPDLEVVAQDLKQSTITPDETQLLSLTFVRDGYTGPVTIKMFPSQQAKQNDEAYREPFVVTQNGLPSGIDTLFISEVDGLTENNAPANVQGQVQQRLSNNRDRFAVGEDLIVAPRAPARCPADGTPKRKISLPSFGSS